ncbi:hypothetical protein [Rhodococcus sp. B50]|uniref:hypothetical protein n=1 Tax=Rhodococcus sp. B50 TaxID=2682847 RepID=UPI001BD43C62|nr:hypothetical protein [Rhodococcus sp. B50]
MSGREKMIAADRPGHGGEVIVDDAEFGGVPVGAEVQPAQILDRRCRRSRGRRCCPG